MKMPFGYEIGKKKWSFQGENGPKRCISKIFYVYQFTGLQIALLYSKANANRFLTEYNG